MELISAQEVCKQLTKVANVAAECRPVDGPAARPQKIDSNRTGPAAGLITDFTQIEW